MLILHTVLPPLSGISLCRSHKEDNCHYHFIKMCPISNIFPLTYLTTFFPFFFSISNSNHHSPPSLPGSNSFSFFVCEGPLLSSLRRALIRSATLNKEGNTVRERESDMERQSSSGDIRMSINPARGAAKGP